MSPLFAPVDRGQVVEEGGRCESSAGGEVRAIAGGAGGAGGVTDTVGRGRCDGIAIRVSPHSDRPEWLDTAAPAVSGGR
jgi:hypothetical protein